MVSEWMAGLLIDAWNEEVNMPSVSCSKCGKVNMLTMSKCVECGKEVWRCSDCGALAMFRTDISCMCKDEHYTMDVRRAVLKEAEDAVCKARHQAYGPVDDSFACIARIASAALSGKLKEPFTATDVAIFMVCLKIARVVANPDHRDSWVDLAGYAACGMATRGRDDKDKAQATAQVPCSVLGEGEEAGPVS